MVRVPLELVMDHRYLARPRDLVVHPNRRTATIVLLDTDEEGDLETEYEVPILWEVCPTCGGRGQYVNPDIDSHGLAREDFDDDPDFAEGYFAGRYDVQCRECGGEKVVPTPDPASPLGRRWLEQEEARARDRAEDAYTMRMENGGWDQ